ncbi:plasmid recombination protein [Burkholderia cenocepacia]|uniref:plasmid recombination protein n=1 Tax=Burkholderia cenocepacia TaxID=95486 RepID=UPI0009AFD94F|nr:plasmid recombination protein [Burkholderia cenocepacia]
MKEGSYQFIHVDAYGREGSSQTKTSTNKHGAKVTTTTKSRSAKEILAEQWRESGACPHIKEPRKPGLLYGVPPMEVLPLIDQWADQAKDAQGRKLRKDGNCALIGVASLPREMEDNFPEFAEDTLVWLKGKYGDRLKSVVVHDDEAHPHLHFTVVPRIGERFDDIHEGLKAKNEAKKNNKKAGEQNLAYIEAMRAMQDEFSKKVAMSHGLTRIGPGRRRLTRAQWKAEKAQAAFFADAKAQHKAARKNGYKVGLKQAEEKTKALGAKVGSWFAGALGGFHKPTAQALEQVEKAQQEAEKKKKKADAYAKQAKEWADKRVATVGNQITLEKSKNAELEKEVEGKDKKLDDQATVIQWYQKKFGKAPDNLPKIK